MIDQGVICAVKSRKLKVPGLFMITGMKKQDKEMLVRPRIIMINVVIHASLRVSRIGT